MAFCGEFQKNSKKCRLAIEFTDHKCDCVYYMYDFNRFTVCASKWQIEFFRNVNQVNMHAYHNNTQKYCLLNITPTQKCTKQYMRLENAYTDSLSW